MAYLPPQEVDQVRSLLSMIADPKSAQKLLDKLIKADGDLDQKKQDIDAIANEARNKFEVESKKAQDLQAEAIAQLSLADERLQKAISLEVSVKEASQKNEDTSSLLDSIKTELTTLDSKLNQRDRSVSMRESATSQKEVSLSQLEAALEIRKQDLDARYAKLKEAAQ